MIFKIENTTIELKDNKVFINSSEIFLQEKIYSALLLFIQSNNKVISKDELMKTLWQNTIVSDDSLFKIIQELRKLFESHGLSGSIVNVYGKGYKVLPLIISQTPSQTIRIVESNIEAKKINKKKFKIIVSTILLSSIILFLFYTIYNQKEDQISQQQYLSYKELIKKKPQEFSTLFYKSHTDDSLTIKDKIRLNFLNGFVLLKDGNFSQSTDLFNKALLLSESVEAIDATADSYYLLAWINTFTNKPDLMLDYINKAKSTYTQLNDEIGILNTEIIKGKYYIVVEDFEKGIKVFKQVIQDTALLEDSSLILHAHSGIAQIYFLQGKLKIAKNHMDSALEIALDEGDGKHISLAYGYLSTDSMRLGKFSDAMKQAQLTVTYAIKENDKNMFQQNFSSFYNILSTFGYDDLAGKYLKTAISYQNLKNSDGHLTIAEINLGILNLKKGNFEIAQNIFENLLTYETSKPLINEAIAWLSLVRYFQKDNIGSYSLAIEVYNDVEVTDKTKLMLGINLILSGIELERLDKANLVFQEIKGIEKQNWLIENSFFLEMAIKLHTNKSPELLKKYLKEQQNFQQRLAKIKLNTKPEELFLTELDEYINNVFMP